MAGPNLNLTSQDDLTDAELNDVKQSARERLRIWKSRFLKTGVMFLLSCASVYPFLYGHSLHSHWESFGKYLVLLSMGLLLPFVYCGGITWVAGIYIRDLEKIK
jgi:hypothetical protein